MENCNYDGSTIAHDRYPETQRREEEGELANHEVGSRSPAGLGLQMIEQHLLSHLHLLHG